VRASFLYKKMDNVATQEVKRMHSSHSLEKRWKFALPTLSPRTPRRGRPLDAAPQPNAVLLV
jgi:hypothetical protein